jgi:hypothetical protein
MNDEGTGMNKIQVYYFAKGHLGQYERWWYLNKHDDGTYTVTSEWDDVSTNGGDHSSGEQEMSVEDALKIAPHEAVTKIKELLNLP